MSEIRYYVMQESKDGYALFLVDRSKIRDRWWTTDIEEAISFHSDVSALRQVQKLSKNSPKVITSEIIDSYVYRNQILKERFDKT